MQEGPWEFMPLTVKVGEVEKFTPHFLKAIKAICLFHEEVPEQLIMEQTGHSSFAVQSYKMTSTDLINLFLWP